MPTAITEFVCLPKTELSDKMQITANVSIDATHQTQIISTARSYQPFQPEV